jgi:hypothetical protein
VLHATAAARFLWDEVLGHGRTKVEDWSIISYRRKEVSRPHETAFGAKAVIVSEKREKFGTTF